MGKCPFYKAARIANGDYYNDQEYLDKLEACDQKECQMWLPSKGDCGLIHE